MKAFRNRFLPIAMVAGLAVLGVACEQEDPAEDPGIENGDVEDGGLEDGGLEDGGAEDGGLEEGEDEM